MLVECCCHGSAPTVRSFDQPAPDWMRPTTRPPEGEACRPGERTACDVDVDAAQFGDMPWCGSAHAVISLAHEGRRPTPERRAQVGAVLGRAGQPVGWCAGAYSSIGRATDF